ncbi:Uma2 family endonuclease [Methylomagnum ishizawai]|uniref:Uma2 family endonuclease n=1 Tax=Methylomagnum ishizawai TaxID=1760988 RepID=UPI001C33DB35|nr:Uma2 family endonuclease [Methylomagnum ishizawai]BBL74797.1 hypothetical protein MishRS11D_18950 [Methylomagnum ishizawai]
MEAQRLNTVDDLLRFPEERVELINGEIVQRPMARSEHALVQAGISDEVSPLRRKDGPGGWWIMTEISVSVRYASHDLAGWRKERVPNRPTGIMDIIPDWVCEITSPGHERKDIFHNFLLLQRHGVAYYWVISPEDKTLIAYEWVEGRYRVVFAMECRSPEDFIKVRVSPFEGLEMDLDYIFGQPT